MKNIEIEFKPFRGEKEVLNMEQAKEKVKTIISTTDIKRFEKDIMSGILLGYNDNYFQLKKEKK